MWPWIAGIIGALAPLLGYGLDRGAADRANEQQRLRTDEANRMLEHLISQFSGGGTRSEREGRGGLTVRPHETDSGIPSGADLVSRLGMPTFMLGGEPFEMEGADPNRFLDLDEYFDTGYETNDFSDYLQAALGAIGAGSGARTQAAREQGVAQALASGRGLEDAMGGVTGLEFGEQQFRAGEASKALGNQAGLAEQSNQFGASMTMAERQAAMNTLGNYLNIGEGSQQFSEGLSAQMQQQLNSLMAALTSQQASQLAGIQDIVPMPGNYITASAQGAISPWQMMMMRSPEPKSSFGAGLGFGDESFGNLGPSTNIGWGCIDGDAEVVTQRGPMALRLVAPDDSVLCDDGAYHVVLAKDYGDVPEGSRTPFIRVRTETCDLVLTEDHPIGAKQAKWIVPGEKLPVGSDGLIETVLQVAPAEYRKSGDLMVDGDARVLFNNLPVNSQLAAGGLNEYGRHIENNLGGIVQDGRVHSAANPKGVWAVAEKE